MSTLRTVTLVLTLFGVLGSGVRADQLPQVEEVCQQVQSLLGVADHGDDPLRPLTELIAQMNRDSHALTTANLIRVAESLERGVQPGAMSREIMNAVKVSTTGHLSDEFVKPYGTYFQREHIIDAMKEQVCRNAELSAASRRSLARGAVVLAAQDLFCRHPVVVVKLIDDTSFSNALALEPKKLEQLKEICNRPVPRGLGWGALAEPINALCDETDAARCKELQDKFLRVLPEVWNQSSSYVRGRWMIAHEIWLFQCLLTARKQAESLRDLKGIVEKLHEVTSDPDERRWLTEAGTFPGPAPRSGAAGIIIREPNDTKPKR